MRNFGSLDGGVVSLPDVLVHRAQHEGDRPFLVDVDGDRATYAETLDRAQRWAGALRQIGVGEHITVSTMLPSSVEATALWLGIAGLRAWEAPVHPSYRGAMLEHAVNTVRAETLIVSHTFLSRIVESGASLPRVRTVVVVGGEPVDAPFHVVAAGDLLGDARPVPLADAIPGHELSAIIFTSGTTGPSKGVMVPWAQLAAFSVRQFPYADFTPEDCWYLYTPSSHIGAKSWPYLAAMVGGRVLLRAEFKTDRFVADVKEHGVTTVAMVPAIAHFLAASPPAPEDVDLPLRNVVMAGAFGDPDGFRARFRVRMCTTYSMTEICTPFTSDGWDVTNWDAVGTLKGGYPGLEVRVVDEHDELVGPGELGELIIRTDTPWTLNAGYFAAPDATAAAWRNGWFHTGDGFRYDKAGFYYFVDRIKDSIRRRGENISSFEVEAVVAGHEDVAECAAVAVPSDVGEDEIKVCVVALPGRLVNPAGLLRWSADRMPRYMVPRYVEVLDALPRTMGTLRVQKAILRAAGITATTWDRETAASR